MRAKLLAFALIGVLALGACAKAPQHGVTKDWSYHNEQVYHFADGRYGYQDNGVWFWLYISQMNAATRTSYVSTSYYSSSAALAPSGSLPPGAAWSRGSAPAKDEVDKATPEKVEVVEEPNGEPVEVEANGEAIEPVAANENEAPAAGEQAPAGQPEEHAADTGGSSPD